MQSSSLTVYQRGSRYEVIYHAQVGSTGMDEIGERRVLLTVSGNIPDGLDDEVRAGRRPRADYRVLAERFDADVVDVSAALAATGRIGAVAHRIGGPGLLLAWFLVLNGRRYEAIVTDGEHVGLPYAALSRLAGRRRARHVMIFHVVTPPKRRLFRWLALGRRIDRYVTYASRQREAITDELGVTPAKVVRIPFMVDTEFFSPPDVAPAPGPRPLIISVGRERRDFPTLIEAVADLPVDVQLTAASLWSRRGGAEAPLELPPNVRVDQFDYDGLRDLYERADLVVVPLESVDFQAGITAILEAMAMGCTVVCTRVPGQTDTIVDDRTGVYVAPHDATALRRTIEELLADDERRRRIGAAALDWVRTHASVERYAEQFAAIATHPADAATSGP
jgi:glycosyltransferase involved in cell wall biosynthesis